MPGIESLKSSWLSFGIVLVCLKFSFSVSSQTCTGPLWQHTNHNGISEQFELHELTALRVTALELNYKESKQTDEYGNRFRYRAKVKSDQSQTGRWAWDVFLTRAGS